MSKSKDSIKFDVVRLSVNVPRELRNNIKLIALHHGTTAAQVVIDLLVNGITKEAQSNKIKLL